MLDSEPSHVSRWCLAAPVEEVAAILTDVVAIPEWWPGGYLKARTIDPGGAGRLGHLVELVSKAPLLGCYRWQYQIVELQLPKSFRFTASGDLKGTGEWRFEQQGEIAIAELLWRITPKAASAPGMNALYRWKHGQSMREGERCLCAELKRRRRLNGSQAA